MVGTKDVRRRARDVREVAGHFAGIWRGVRLGWCWQSPRGTSDTAEMEIW